MAGESSEESSRAWTDGSEKGGWEVTLASLRPCEAPVGGALSQRLWDTPKIPDFRKDPLNHRAEKIFGKVSLAVG